MQLQMEKAFLVDVFANELTKAFRSDAEFEVEAGGHQSFDLMLASMDSSSKPVELHQIMWLNSVLNIPFFRNCVAKSARCPSLRAVAPLGLVELVWIHGQALLRNPNAVVE